MTDPTSARRLSLTPSWLIFGLLVVEGLLWLSERMQWPTWHKGYAVVTTIASVGVVFVVMLLWFIASLFFRWQFQFSIRSLLVLVVAVAVPCSWLAVEMKWAGKQTEVVNEIKHVNGSEMVDDTPYPRGSMKYDWEFDADGGPLPNAQPPGPIWLRNLLGEDFFGTVVEVDFGNDVFDIYAAVTDATLERFKGLTQLRKLNLSYTHITDAGLGHLRSLTSLKSLLLSNTQVTDKGLEYLKGLTGLERLLLDDTQVTDKGLKHLGALTRLQSLELNNTQVTDTGLKGLECYIRLKLLWLNNTSTTDAGLSHLAGLTQLEEVNLCRTQVTDAGVKKLQHALPNCTIYH